MKGRCSNCCSAWRYSSTSIRSPSAAAAVSARPQWSAALPVTALAPVARRLVGPAIVLTLLVLLVLIMVIPPLFRWAVLNADWTATNRDACPADGACWGIIPNRFHQYMFGLYPVDQYWRLFLGGFLLLAGCVPLLLPQMPRKALYGVCFAIIYPIIASMLFEGGWLVQPVVETPLWGGLFLTLLISIVGIVASFPIGIVLALGRRSQMPAVKALCVSFIELVRGVPLVTVLFMASVMLPLLMPETSAPDKMLRALGALILFVAAYMAEAIRGGLAAVAAGQREAAASLGFGRHAYAWLIALPQAMRAAIPALTGIAIGTFKDTSLVTIVSLYELTGSLGLALNSDADWRPFKIEGYLFIASIYFIFCFSMSRYSVWIEKQVNKGKAR